MRGYAVQSFTRMAGMGDVASDALAWKNQAIINNDNARNSILKWLAQFQTKYPTWYAWQVTRANGWHDFIAKGIETQYQKLIAGATTSAATGVSGLGDSPFPLSQCAAYDASDQCVGYRAADYPAGYPTGASGGSIPSWALYGGGALVALMLLKRR